MNRQPREINSLELFTLLDGEKKEGERFAHFTTVVSDPKVVKLDDGRRFLINDDPPTTNRSRSLEELRKLHLTDEEWSNLGQAARTPTAARPDVVA
jgi:hypothetical protein